MGAIKQKAIREGMLNDETIDEQSEEEIRIKKMEKEAGF